MTTWTPARRDSDVPVGINVAWGAAAIVVTGFVAATVPARHTDARLVVVAVTVGLFALLTGDALAAAAIVALGWLVDNGFLVDRFGQLEWHGSADAVRLAVLMAVAGLGLLAARRRRPADPPS